MLLGFTFAKTGRSAAGLTGSSALLYVPVANVTPNEHFSFGGLISDYQAFPSKQFSYFRLHKPSSYFAGYLALGYVPRLEITIKGSGMPSAMGPAGTGPFYTDGMISVQALAYRGEGRFPSVAFGFQDIYGFMLFNALYGVATWTIPRGQGSALVTSGWAVDWYDRNRGTADVDYVVPHVMNGFVAGASYPIREWMDGIVEYDSRSLNFGLRVHPLSWCTFDVAAVRWGLDNVARRSAAGFAAHLQFHGNL
jgi:hypothetical protein